MSVYLDCAATTPMDPHVLEVCVRYLRDDFGNAASRTHSQGATARQAVEHARDQIAAVAGVNRGDVIFTSGATESNNLAILGLAFILWRVLLTAHLFQISYHCARQGNVLPLLLAAANSLNLFMGSLSQPTALGFTALCGGLCLAAARAKWPDELERRAESLARARQRRGGRGFARKPIAHPAPNA